MEPSRQHVRVEDERAAVLPSGLARDRGTGAKAGPPPEGSYRYVLARSDVNPRIEQVAHAYAECCRSRRVVLGGREVAVLFVRTREARDRFIKMGRPPAFGWRDVTEDWHRKLARETADPRGVALEAVRAAAGEEGWAAAQDLPADLDAALTGLVAVGVLEKALGGRGGKRYRVKVAA